MLKTILLGLILVSSTVFAGRTEQIMGVNVNMDGITYQVQSGGCTDKEDFTLLQLETFPIQLKLVRENEDFCEAFLPYGTDLKFTWKELGLKNGSEFMVANPISRIRVFTR